MKELLLLYFKPNFSCQIHSKSSLSLRTAFFLDYQDMRALIENADSFK